MERMVTLLDLEKYPELRYKGVSLNQLFDFQYLEQADADNQYQRPMQPPPLKQQSIQVPEGTVTTIHVPNNVHEHKRQPAKVEAPTKKVKKEAPAKKEVKKEAVKKPVPVKEVKQVPVKTQAKVIPVKKVGKKKGK